MGSLKILRALAFAGLTLLTAQAQAEDTEPAPFDVAWLDKYTDTAPEALTPDMGLGNAAKSASLSLKEALQNQLEQWRGTPHRLGGTGESGIDCSALVRSIFSSVAGLELPRSSREQQKEGASVARTELRTGDLVFFKSGPTGRHVGIYVSDGKFLHTSSLMGVTISSLDEAYWKKRYVSARRLSGMDALR